MALVTGVTEAGTEAFYDIPDSELSKYEVKSARLTDDVREQLFPGKDEPTKDDAHGVILAAPSAGADVEGYAAACLYYVIQDGSMYYWYAPC